MQHELYLRLVKDGKIVGYVKYARINPLSKKVCCTYSDHDDGFFKTPVGSLEVRCESHVYEKLDAEIYEELDFDAFELRSPFKDNISQWLWEGDTIRIVGLNYETAIMYGKWEGLMGCGYGFYIENFDGLHTSLCPNEKYIEKIGTIHDDLKGVEGAKTPE